MEIAEKSAGNKHPLKPFTKGDKRIKAGPGRPRKWPLTQRYKEILEERLPTAECKKLGLKGTATIGDAIAMKMASQAYKKGDVLATREIREAVEGKATQRIELSGPDGSPIEIESSAVRTKLLGEVTVIDVEPVAEETEPATLADKLLAE